MDEYAHELKRVFEWLDDNGFAAARDALYQEFERREHLVASQHLEPALAHSPQPAASPPADAGSPVASAVAARATDFGAEARSVSGSLGGRPEHESTGGVQASSRRSTDPHDRPSASKPHSRSHSQDYRRVSDHYNDGCLDEYDGPDDAGYRRRPVQNQQLFLSTELELVPDEEGTELLRQPGSGALGGGCSVSGGGAGGSASAGSSPSNSHGNSHGSEASLSSIGFSSKAASARTASLVSGTGAAGRGGHATAGYGSSGGAGGGGSTSKNGGSSSRPAAGGGGLDDEEWDDGPTIKIAEPVSTPTKHVSRRSSTDQQPSLSRVESLSNSFIDELESLEGNASTPLSEANSADLDRAAAAAAAAEFGGRRADARSATALPPVTPVDFTARMYSIGRHGQPSISSSLDVKYDPSEDVETLSDLESQGGASAAAVVGRGLKVQTHPPPDKAAQQQGEGLALGGGGGGFSFPVTPPADQEPEVEDRAERVFQTWVSSQSRSGGGASAEYYSGGGADEDGGSSSATRSPAPQLAAAVEKELWPREDAGRPGAAGQPATAAAAGDEAADAPDRDTFTWGSLSAARAAEKLKRPVRETTSIDLMPEEVRGATQRDEDVDPNAVAQRVAQLTLKEALPEALHTHIAPGVTAVTASSGDQGRKAAYDAAYDEAAAYADAYEAATAALPDLVAATAEAGGVGRLDLPSEEVSGGGMGESELVLQELRQEVSLDNSTPMSGVDALNSPGLMPRYTVDEEGHLLYEYDQAYIDSKYEVFDLRIIHRRHHTGFEETKDFPIRQNDLIAGRYQVMDFLGSAAFSRAVQALDLQTGSLVCLKIIKNNKDYFDQSLDEIKLLRYVNGCDPADQHGIVRLFDYFYYKEHLFLVCELLRANLYEFQKYNKESGDEPYFTLPRLQRIAEQVLRSLAFLHSLDLIHSDLKPENILIRSYSKCEVKVIDLGSSCFRTDHLSSYVQSRSYRAPEVILGLPYDHKIDVWSLGCILAELASGFVLFQNDSVATLLARLEGILGPLPGWMIKRGRYANRFYTKTRLVYERSQTSGRYEVLQPKRTSLRHRIPVADDGFLDFISFLLAADPKERPTADAALSHPWLQHEYPPVEPVQD